jgi:hypothetical protein
VPRLRRRSPQRPDRPREHEGRTAAALGRCRDDVANRMIESSRRHGHFDARWHTKSVNSPRALVSPAHDGDPIQSWENEGGRFSTSNENDASAGLEWRAFSTRYFPGQRRHYLEALKAYEAYRSAAIEPSSGPRRAPNTADLIRRRALRPSRSSEVSAIRVDRLGRGPRRIQSP